MSVNKQRGITVVITEQLACGHFCDIVYPMVDEYDLTLKTGPITSINPTYAFPDLSVLFSSLDRTLELSGKHGEPSYIGITAKDGRLSCAECGTLLFAIGRTDEGGER